MQVQDKRDASPQSEVRRPVRALNPNYQISPNGSSDLFAEIFQGIAALTAPEPAQKTGQADLPPAEASDETLSSEEAASTEEDRESIDDDVLAVANPTLPSAIQSTNDEAVPDANLEQHEIGACCTAKDESSTHSSTESQIATSDVVAKAKPEQTTTDATEVASVQSTTSEDANAIVLPSDSPKRQSDNPSDDKDTLALQSDEPEPGSLEPSSIQTPTTESNETDAASAAMSGAPRAAATSSDSDSGPRDRRDRRPRGSDTERRAGGASLETAEARAVEAKQANANAPSVPTSTSTASSELTSAKESPAVSLGSLPTASATPGPVSASVAAVAAAASQANSTPASGPSIRGESSSGTSPVMGGSPATGTDVAEAANTKSTPASRQAEAADRARLVHRIAKAFQRMGVDGGQIRLRMHPDDLGSVQLDMKVSGRTVAATVIADNDEAVQLLQGSLSELRQRLESQGLLVEKLEVERRAEEESSGAFSQNPSQNHAQYGGQSGQNDGLWGRSTAARANSLGSNTRISGQNPDLSANAASPRRVVLSGDRALDLTA